MSTKQKVIILKKKNGGTKGIAVRKTSGMIVINKDSNGDIISITKNSGSFYINGTKYSPSE